jgi:hypothetical protein
MNSTILFVTGEDDKARFDSQRYTTYTISKSGPNMFDHEKDPGKGEMKSFLMLLKKSKKVLLENLLNDRPTHIIHMSGQVRTIQRTRVKREVCIRKFISQHQ